MKYIGYLFLLLVLASCTMVQAASSSVQQWADAAVQGDYSTARDLSSDGEMIFAAWQGATEQARRAGFLDNYRIATTEQRGATMHYCVEFTGHDRTWPTHFTNVFVDHAGKVSSPFPYSPGRCQ